MTAMLKLRAQTMLDHMSVVVMMDSAEPDSTAKMMTNVNSERTTAQIMADVKITMVDSTASVTPVTSEMESFALTKMSAEPVTTSALPMLIV
jgi:hypothetical protein